MVDDEKNGCPETCLAPNRRMPVRDAMQQERGHRERKAKCMMTRSIFGQQPPAENHPPTTYCCSLYV